MHQRAVKPALPDQPAARRDSRIPAAPESGRPTTAPPAGWDFSKIPLYPPGQPALGSWASSVLRAPHTTPADVAERSADRAAAAAVERTAAAPVRRGGRTVRRHAAVGRRPVVEPRGARVARAACRREPRGHPRSRRRRARALGRGARRAGLHHRAGRCIGRRPIRPGRCVRRGLLAHELSHVVTGRGHAPVLARVALSAADFDAIADSLHDTITTAAAGEELIYVALQKLERDPAAVRSLTGAYKKRYTSDLLTDLGSRLKGRGLAIARTLLGAKGGLAVGGETAWHSRGVRGRGPHGPHRSRGQDARHWAQLCRAAPPRPRPGPDCVAESGLHQAVYQRPGGGHHREADQPGRAHALISSTRRVRRLPTPRPGSKPSPAPALRLRRRLRPPPAAR